VDFHLCAPSIRLFVSSIRGQLPPPHRHALRNSKYTQGGVKYCHGNFYPQRNRRRTQTPWRTRSGKGTSHPTDAGWRCGDGSSIRRTSLHSRCGRRDPPTAKSYLVGISKGPIVFQAPGIEARAPSMEQLLAMKLSAWRDDVDISDARRLLEEVGRGRKGDEAWQSLEPFLVKGDELTAQYAFWDLWESLYGTN